MGGAAQPKISVANRKIMDALLAMMLHRKLRFAPRISYSLFCAAAGEDAGSVVDNVVACCK